MIVNIPIFCFHQIGKSEKTKHLGIYLSEKKFGRILSWIKLLGYQVISLSEAVEKIKSGNSNQGKFAVLTFDDGYEGVYSSAFSLLKKHNYKATVFLISDMINNSQAATSFPYLNLNQITEMMSSGIEFGCHTASHADLTRLDKDEELKEEIVDSKKKIEDLLGASIKHFCYPFGKFNERVSDYVCRSGYSSASTTTLGRNHSGQDFFSLKRISIPFEVNFLQFFHRLEILSKQN